MQRILQSDAVRQALQAKGWTQKDLAEQVGVSAQSVTNWLKGDDFPRPDKLLRLATTLRLRLDQLAAATPAEQALRPVVAFRRRAATKTTEAHIAKALAMGALLEPLVPHLQPLRALRTSISQPLTAYADLQRAAAQTREKLGIGPHAVLEYATLISEFAANDAFLVPVLWGERQRHDNALHILLPVQRVTFIYLNLDTYIEDFKFWMAHELAHVYTPALAGTNEGEDFADAFAGALLFPQAVAAVAYRDAAATHRKAERVAVLQRHAQEHQISLYTVFREAQAHAAASGQPALPLDEKADIHAVRNARRGQRVSEILFDPLPPEPATYVAAAHSTFGSEFFNALRRLLKAQGTGPGYMQQLLDISLADATALHHALTRG
ncbi:MAG: helix-turn-helix transcriptional regulator [Betaproteobacteria bacterium]|jgi:transcriptional regulator with XRE-family HTH domain|nr:helix-turn-helix transcriptional regulator [Betaproteobacteria bacterium]MBK8108143.1 helix-turn-helix transcriptional regulator [Betaproteobacteria bacterium]